jgi:Integrase core domain
VAGWAIAEHMRAELVEDALNAAHALRGTLAGAVFHVDHGSQYTSKDFAKLCRELGVTQSMGAVGSWTMRWLNRSTPLSNAKSCKTVAAGPTRPPAAGKCSGGWPAITPNDVTPTATMSAPPTMKGPTHPLRCPKRRNHKSLVH